MAKPFRDTPLVWRPEDFAADDRVGLPILNSRINWAEERMPALVGRFDDEFILHVATEVGLDECVSYVPSGEMLQFDLTALQLVAFCAALSAVAELRDSGEGRLAHSKVTKRKRDKARR